MEFHPSMNKIVHTKEYNLDVLSWTEAFLNYDLSVKLNEEIKFSEPGFFVCHSGHRIEKVKEILNDLNCKIAHLYFNITTIAKTFGNHKDTMNVWFWQCQGATKWIIDNDEYILNPGDLIYVPKETYHNVIPLSPRLGVSMSYE
tara:strand:+ start:40 stop:471 length:432 start_codon:yes stop_codon:yes gene_type:complete